MAPAQIVNKKPMDTRQPALTISKNTVMEAELQQQPRVQAQIQVRPILKGILSHDENGVVTWKGNWGMKESDFNDENASSLEPFLYQRQYVLVTESDNSNKIKEEKLQQGNTSKATSIDRQAEALAIDASFSGHFYVKRSPGMFSPRQSRTVRSQEKNLIIRFIKSPKLEHYQVLGSGKNRFGKFTLEGTFIAKTGQMDLVRIYSPRTSRCMNSNRVKRELKDLGMGVNHQDTLVSSMTTANDGRLSIRKGKRVRKASAKVKDIFDENIHFKKTGVKGEGEKIEHMTTLLKKVMHEDHDRWFCVPVDAEALGLKDYHDIVENPMDLGTIETRLKNNYYATAACVKADIELTFQNALHYNQRGHPVYKKAQSLLKVFMAQFSEMQSHLRDRTNELTRKSSSDSSESSGSLTKSGKRSRMSKVSFKPSDSDEEADKHVAKKQKPTCTKSKKPHKDDTNMEEVKMLREKVKMLGEHLKQLENSAQDENRDSDLDHDHSETQSLSLFPLTAFDESPVRTRADSFTAIEEESLIPVVEPMSVDEFDLDMESLKDFSL